MAERRPREWARDLAWSLWTELGVPGVGRNHSHQAIDPEPLILWTPDFASDDPRLEDLAYSWCAQHADRISTTRLHGLLRAAPPGIAQRFSAFSHDLRVLSKVRWPGGESTRHEPQPREIRPIRLPLERPALVRLRARSVFGVGATADVVCELLARPSDWIRASDLEGIGFSKRSVARVLADLAAAGVTEARAKGNAVLYRVQKPAALADLVGAEGLSWPPWTQIFHVATLLSDLERASTSPDGVRRVRAHEIGEKLRPLAKALWVEPVPETRGVPDADARVARWGHEVLRQVVRGRAPGAASNA